MWSCRNGRCAREFEPSSKESKRALDLAPPRGWTVAQFHAVAADTRTMTTGTELMVHTPWSLLLLAGTADTVERAAAKVVAGLRSAEKTYRDVLVERTGASRQQASAWLKDDTWSAPEEAVAAGFATAVAISRKTSTRRWLTAIKTSDPGSIPHFTVVRQPPCEGHRGETGSRGTAPYRHRFCRPIRVSSLRLWEVGYRDRSRIVAEYPGSKLLERTQWNTPLPTSMPSAPSMIISGSCAAS